MTSKQTPNNDPDENPDENPDNDATNPEDSDTSPFSDGSGIDLSLIFNLFATVEKLRADLLPFTGQPDSDEDSEAHKFAKAQLEIMNRENLLSNSIIEVYEQNKHVVRVNRKLVQLNQREQIVLEILLRHLIKQDFDFVSSHSIIQEIPDSSTNSTWKDPQPGDIATVICNLKKKLPAGILESPKKRGAGYGHRISIPPQNVVVNRKDEMR